MATRERETAGMTALGSEEERVGRPRLPLLTLVLAGVNWLFWLALLPVGGAPSVAGVVWGLDKFPALIALGAKANAAISAGEWWRLITAMFLHGNLVHLVINTYALLLLGGFIEALYGRRRLLILYVMSGLGGNVASYMMSPHSSVGASTAIAGLFGAVMVFWWKYRAAIAPEYWSRMGRQLFGLLFINVLLGAAFPMIDSWGHLGGLVAGVFVAALAESRLSGEIGREREWLPVPLALATVLSLLIYAGIEMARGATRPQPLITAQRAITRQDWPRAAAALRAARTVPPELLHHYALALMSAGREAEAEPVYRQILRLQPNDALALNNLAYIYADALNRNLDEALIMAQRATDLAPAMGVYQDTLGWVLYRLGRYDAALRVMREAVRLEPKSAELRYHLGAVHEARGERAAALREYQEALRLQADLKEAKAALQRLERG